MAITAVGTATGAGSSITATTASVTVPTGSVGDILLISVAASANASNTSAPLISSSSALPTLVAQFHSVYCQAALYYRVVASGDPTSYTFTTTSGAPIAITCARYSGVSQTTPIRNWNYRANLASSSNTTTSETVPALDGVQSTDLVIAAASMGTSAFNTTQATALTAAPSGWTNVVNRVGPTSVITSSSHTAMALYSRLAATDTPTVSGSTGMWATFALALVDAANPVPLLAGEPVAFVAATTAASTATGTTSLAVTRPAGVNDGDTLILIAANSSGISRFTPPAGWLPLELHKGYLSAGTTSYVNNVCGQLWYKIASAEPASYTVTCTSSGEFVLAALAYRGTRVPYPVRIHGGTNTATATATTSSAPYPLPNVAVDQLILDVYLSGAAATGTYTVTGPSGTWTQRAQAKSAVASDFNASITVASKPGATDYPTASASTNQSWVVFSLALAGVPVVRSSAFLLF